MFYSFNRHFHFQSPVHRLMNRLLCGIIILVFSVMAPTANALVKIDKQSIDLALKYGIQNQGMGYQTLLGNNWIEGPEGMLLNVYTPFMMLASKGYQSGLPADPTTEDLKKAKGQCGSLIRYLTDPLNRIDAKFAVSMYGDDPAFAGDYKAIIEGVGRGREFRLKPVRQFLQKVATKDAEASVRPYEAINSYYFNFADLQMLDDYRLILRRSDGTESVFHIRNDKIY